MTPLAAGLLLTAAAIACANLLLRRHVIRCYMDIHNINWDEAAQLADQDAWWLQATWRERARAALRWRR